MQNGFFFRSHEFKSIERCWTQFVFNLCIPKNNIISSDRIFDLWMQIYSPSNGFDMRRIHHIAPSSEIPRNITMQAFVVLFQGKLTIWNENSPQICCIIRMWYNTNNNENFSWRNLNRKENCHINYSAEAKTNKKKMAKWCFT